jgi:Glu-tRNA(Gln) amidotransferase subunit E-like FAD-binding protein
MGSFYYTANDISKALEIYKIVNVGKKLFSKSETEVNDENNRWE